MPLEKLLDSGSTVYKSSSKKLWQKRQDHVDIRTLNYALPLQCLLIHYHQTILKRLRTSNHPKLLESKPQAEKPIFTMGCGPSRESPSDNDNGPLLVPQGNIHCWILLHHLWHTCSGYAPTSSSKSNTSQSWAASGSVNFKDWTTLYRISRSQGKTRPSSTTTRNSCKWGVGRPDSYQHRVR